MRSACLRAFVGRSWPRWPHSVSGDLFATCALSLATVLPPSNGSTVPDIRQWLFGGGVVLVLAGLYLRWQLLDHSISTEERAKDGLLTEDQARLRLLMFRFSGPAVILLGAVAFAFVFAS